MGQLANARIELVIGFDKPRELDNTGFDALILLSSPQPLADVPKE
jgi:hypothetical protein